MRVLIACEFSGIVRDAFRSLGHEAWSCDLLDTEQSGPHIKESVFRLLNKDPNWHLMIFHWPCTTLCNSGVRWLLGNEHRQGDMEVSARCFRALYEWPSIPRVCGENPIPHKYAKEFMGDYSQIIQPWMFGHGETKATCLWLRGLPNLKPTNIVQGRVARVHRASPGTDRWKERSRTLPGIAQAMAEQWGSLGSELVRQDGNGTGTGHQTKNPFRNIGVKQNAD